MRLSTVLFSKLIVSHSAVAYSAAFSNKTLLPKGRLPKGIIFDMDGTLIEPVIDFKKMRETIYSIADEYSDTRGMRIDVLELCELMPSEGQVKAKEAFDKIEKKAIEDMKIMHGLPEALRLLDSFGIKRAVLTRNVMTSVFAFEKLLKEKENIHMPFDPLVSRDYKCPITSTSFPPKPEPDAILHICERWNVTPDEVIMIGDSVKDDIVCAYRAGCDGILIDHGQDNCAGGSGPDDDEECLVPTLSLKSMKDLCQILQATSEFMSSPNFREEESSLQI